MSRLRLARLRRSFVAICLAALGWSAGCATPGPMIDPYFASRSYTPARVTVMPPDVFVIYDEVGDNDPQKSAALSRQVTGQLGGALVDGMRRKGYAVDTSIGWDGLRAADGSFALGGQELGWMAGSILQFSNSQAGAVEGTMKSPAFVAPELAARVGAATGADSVMYVNVKGVAVSPGKRTAQVLGVVFFVVVIVAVVLLVMAESKGGGGGRSRGGAPSAGAAAPKGVRAPGVAAPAGSAVSAGGGTPTAARVVPRGYGNPPPRGGGRVYGGGGPNVSLGVGVIVPLDGPTHTHEGAVADQDETFAGDEAYVSMTLISTYDGRVLWHLKRPIDVDLEKPQDVRRLVDESLATIPPSLGAGAAPAQAATPAAAPPPPPPPPAAVPVSAPH